MASPRITPAMKRDALASSPFFQPMRAEELDAVVAHSTDRRVPRNTVIFNRGDEGHSMMAVLAGRVRVGSTSSEGKELTHRVIGPGEIFGEVALLDGKPRTAHAVAIEDTTLMVVERRTFLPLLLHHEGMVERLLGVLCDRIRRTTTAIEDIALFELPVRLARLICKLADESGKPVPGGVRIEVKLSDTELARLVASTRESVNKQISAWRKIGAVEREGRHLVVRDRPALSRLVE